MKIKNIALIEDVQIEFNKGLNILSGETGAGKSILLNSLNFILGEPIKTDAIRSGETTANIQAVFDISNAKELKEYMKSELGIDTEENLLIISREIDLNKSSVAFINNQRALVQSLKNLSKYLVDIHGQFEHQSLFDKSNHLKLLDKYASLEDSLNCYRADFHQAIVLNKQLKEKIKLEQDKEHFFEFSQYAIKELENAKLKIEEEAALESELSKLSHSQEIKNALEDAFLKVYKSDTSVLSQLQRTQDIFEKIQEKDSEVKKITPLITETLIKMEPVIDFLKSYKERMEFSPERMEEIQKRLELISFLKNKYGKKSIEELLSYRENLLEETEKISKNKDEIENLEKQIDLIISKLGEKALEISKVRKKSALELEKAIEEELHFLGMERAKFSITFESLEDPEGKVELEGGKKAKLSRDGIERVEFLISPNLGEDLKPLVKIASGGEISRIMLSIKNILRKIDPMLTLVFDEIDTGIGGETAFAVGKKLKEIAQNKQVICITHLAQIASMGTFHYKVEKIEEQNRTKTIIYSLDTEGRIKEISRMLSGENVTDISIQHAKQLLEIKK